jgi:D-glycero-D-manno-heptose 1,7-bisphosphate phosphatase
LRRAVFFDRDGTLNEEIGYVGDPSRIRLLPGAPEAVGAVNRAGFDAIVVTNQSGIARGLLTVDAVQSVNQRVLELLELHGSQVDAVYYCPHHPEGTVEAYRALCDCRKPAPGMLRQAAKDRGLTLDASYVIGDKACDVGLAVAVGAKGILVKTGYGNSEVAKIRERGYTVAFMADNVLEAVQWILEDAGQAV